MNTPRNAGSQGSGEHGTDTAWDPYQVWLTRVKQPREQLARARSRERPVATPQVSADAVDTSETARLRHLSPLPSR